jgi:hypothetical protein
VWFGTLVTATASASAQTLLPDVTIHSRNPQRVGNGLLNKVPYNSGPASVVQFVPLAKLTPVLTLQTDGCASGEKR